MDDVLSADEKAEWLKTIVDLELRLYLTQSESTVDYTDDIRGAFVLLERRIRDIAGLKAGLVGQELINAAFHPGTGILQPVSSVTAEREGLHHLLQGIFLYYRNPIAHRAVNFALESPKQVLSLIDHALLLVNRANESAFSPADFVGPHEGQILRRRDYRVDIKGNVKGKPDIVALLELGPVLDGNKMVTHLAPIILEKVDNGYKRIPAEWIQGMSMYGAVGVTVRPITDVSRPDVVVSWAWGETQTLTLILRYDKGRYVLARREITQGTEEPYSGTPSEKGFQVHPRQMLAFVDVDGDGLTEIVQTLLFDREDLEQMGYSGHIDGISGHVYVCRLLKWDAAKGLVVQVEERLVAR